MVTPWSYISTLDSYLQVLVSVLFQVAVSGQITKPCAILSMRPWYTVFASSDVPSFLGSVIRLQSIHLE
jgi:hypothetical protein